MYIYAAVNQVYETLSSYSFRHSDVADFSHLNTVKEKIEKARLENKQIGIVLGRTNSQPLPEEEGWEWFSLDSQDVDVPGNHHLKIDFNKNQQMRHISSLFNKVIVDHDVFKFMHSKPFKTLHALLADRGEVLIPSLAVGKVFLEKVQELDIERLIIEIPKTEYLDYKEKIVEAYYQWEKANPEDAQESFKMYCEAKSTLQFANESLKKQFEASLFPRFQRAIVKKRELLEDPEEKYSKHFCEMAKKYAETLFEEVNLCHDIFPLNVPDALGSRASVKKYWHLKSPKKL